MTNSPVGDIPAKTQVKLDYDYYDFGAEMWWYKASDSDGHSGDAWEWQLDPLAISAPATTAPTVAIPVDLQMRRSHRHPTPINGIVITLGKDSMLSPDRPIIRRGLLAVHATGG